MWAKGAWRGGPAPSSAFGSIDGKAGCLGADRDGRDAPWAGSQPRAPIARIRPLGLIRTALGIGLVALAVTGTAQAYTCPTTPLDQRIAESDVVFVGRSTGSTVVAGAGIAQRLYRFEVDQEVKGDVGRTIDVRIPVNPANGGQLVPLDVAAGILANQVNGAWFTTRCGITDPGAVLAEVDQPRGNAVKLLLGILTLGGVLAYSIRRVKRRDPGASLRR